MNPFKKLKKLLSKRAEQSDKSSDIMPAPIPTPAKEPKYHEAVAPIIAWLDKQEWKYEYRLPENDSRAHHIILGFTDNENDWTCVFRINEENDLVSIFGILDDVVPVSHYTAVLMAFAKANINIQYGSLELDVNDGEVRVKLSFDGEFTNVEGRTLGCFMQGVSGLTELARTIVKGVLLDDTPSQYAGDYIEMGDEVVVKDGDDKQVFFVPTHERQ